MSEVDLVSLQRTLYGSRNPTRRWLHCARRDWISEAIRKFGSRATRSLEIGPGSGVYIDVLKEVSPEVHLADCEEAYLEPIRLRYGHDPAVRVVVDDIANSKLPADYYDLILCTEVVEHIGDSESALRHIGRILKPDGVIILSTPQRYSSLEMTAKLALSPFMIWLTRLLYREPVLDMGHINLMTESTLMTQIMGADLRIIDRHKGGLYLPGIAEIFGRLGQRLAAALERRIYGTRFEGILWTQYYVAARSK